MLGHEDMAQANANLSRASDHLSAGETDKAINALIMASSCLVRVCAAQSSALAYVSQELRSLKQPIG